MSAPSPPSPPQPDPPRVPRSLQSAPNPGLDLDLAAALERLNVGDRAWAVLSVRFPLGKPARTLAAHAQTLGVTRERVRQIQARAIDRIAEHLPIIAPALNALEAEAGRLPSPAAAATAAQRIVSTCVDILQRRGWVQATPEQVTRLLIVVRGLGHGQPSEIATRWPRLAHVACAISPPIVEFPAVARDVALHGAPRTYLTYEALSHAVLKEAGEPLHWREIAQRAKQLGQHRTFSLGSLFNRLSRSDVFVRVGPGTYGLSEWGLQPMPFYPELIADVLIEAGRPLPADAIKAALKPTRPIKDPTLQLLLDIHPRFYRTTSPRRTYGLRQWLDAGRTDLAADEGVEDEKSRQRLAAAAARGFTALVDEDGSIRGEDNPADG